MTDRHDPAEVSRREFVKAGVTAAAAVSLPLAAQAAGPKDEKKSKKKKGRKLVPKRVLGTRTGEKVSILNYGSAGPTNDRLLNAAYKSGIRYFDTADCYGNGKSETTIAKWMAKKDNRKKLFVVTKDHPSSPDEWVEMVDRRLEALQIDTIDLFFLHGLGEDEAHRTVPKKKDWGKAADKMKKAGKIRFAGFSSHTSVPLRIALLNNAAKGSWVDAIMVATDPQLVKTNSRFNKALDACHKAGIGLISMKEMRGVQHAPKFLPEFEEMGLNKHEAVLHAVWTDERFASICSAMPSLKIIKENAAAAKKFKPLDKKKVQAVTDLYKRYASAYCNGCDGSCGQAAGTQAALGDITRCLSYYEMDGDLKAARRAFAKLTPEQRNWRNADLEAASRACCNSLDFASILPRAEASLA